MKSVAINQPPLMAPKKPINTKPRSQTHITNFPESPIKQMGAASNNNGALIENRSSSIGSNGSDMQRTKPLPGKPRGQPPTKPRPLNSPLAGAKKLELSNNVDSTPPPPPPPRKESNPASNGFPKGNATNDYDLLEYASVVALGTRINLTFPTILV